MQNARISSFIVVLAVVIGIAGPSRATTVDCEDDECRGGSNPPELEESVPGLTIPKMTVDTTAIVSDPDAQLVEVEIDESGEFGIPALIAKSRAKKNNAGNAAQSCKGSSGAGYECTGLSMQILGAGSQSWNPGFGTSGDDDHGNNIHSNAGRGPTARSAANWQNGRRTRDTRIDRRADLPLVARAHTSNGPPAELPFPAQSNGRGLPGPLKERPAAAVPEPTAALLFGAGIFVIGMATRRPRA